MNRSVVDSDATGRWDRQALRAGASVAVTFAVPLQIVALALGSDSALAALARIGALAGFLVGAGVAAWVQQRRMPLTHGLACALGAFAVVQVAFIIGRAVAGTELRLGAAVANLAPVLGVGLLGGFLGSRLQRSGLQPRIVRASLPPEQTAPPGADR